MNTPPSPGGRRRAPGPRRVEAMFDDIVEHYQLLNGLMSLGMDRGWRREAAAAIRLPAGARVLDLGCGSGDLGRLLAPRAQVAGVDLSSQMLARAKARVGEAMQLVRGSAFALPFRDQTFAGCVSAFVLRNLNDLNAAFSELSRVLTPGGQIALIDAVEPPSPFIRRLFNVYFGTVAPGLGALVGQPDAYRYLVSSLQQIPPPAEVCGMLTHAGFQSCAARPLTVGAVTLITARRGD